MPTPESFTNLAYLIRHAGEFPASGYRVEMPTDAEMLRALAEAEEPCDRLSDIISLVSNGVRCTGCNATASAPPYLYTLVHVGIPRFPMLREPCPGLQPDQFGHLSWADTVKKAEHVAGRCGCQGRGWVPIQHDVTEELWKAAGDIHPRGFFDYAEEVVQRMMQENEDLRTASLAVAVLVVAEEH